LKWPAQTSFLAGGEPSLAMKSEKQIAGTRLYALGSGCFSAGDFEVRQPRHPRPENHAAGFAFRILDGCVADALGNWICCRSRWQARRLVHEQTALAGNTLALAAAVAVVRLAASFRHANRGWQSHWNDALAICRMRRVLFSCALVLGRERMVRWLLAGILAAFTFVS